MANDPKVEAIFFGLDAIISSIDKSPPKERDSYAPMHLADQFNKLRTAAEPFVRYHDLLPAAVKASASGSSMAKYLDVQIYSKQVRDMLPYSPSIG